jgi:hypothetical protein
VSVMGTVRALLCVPDCGIHRLDDMMGIVGCGFRTYTRQYE